MAASAVTGSGVPPRGRLQSVDGGDVRMIERCERAGLALEARQPFMVVGKAFGQHFQRHVAIELCIAGAVHLTHSARANRRDNLVRPEPLA